MTTTTTSGDAPRSSRWMAFALGCAASAAVALLYRRNGRWYARLLRAGARLSRHGERADARCRAARIDGATARQALGFLQFPLGFDGDNAWELLRGSRSPTPMPVEQARALPGTIE